MKVEIKIPAMGESISEATVSNIMQQSGSQVAQDQEILELETDKVNQVLHAPQAGVLTLNVGVNDKVTIGQVVGYVDTAGAASAPAPAAPAPAAPAPAAPAPAAPAPKAEAPKKAETPAAPVPKKEEGPTSRKMAAEYISEMQEPSPAAVQPPPSVAAPAPKAVTEGKTTRKRMTGLRKVIAQKLVEVKNNTAMLTTFNECDLSQVIELRTKEQENFTKKYGVKLGFMSFFVKAAVAALKAYPEVNAMIDGDEIVNFQSYDIGVAVSTDRGLMVPVIRGCDALSFGQVELAIESFAKKARTGNISIDDMKGGSFTITNGGRFGSLLSTPILNPPQSAILGMHAIVKRPMVVGDQILPRPMMYLALSYDHRIIDGKEAVLFLVHMKENLEDPSRLLLEL